jgi:hypothetical protein
MPALPKGDVARALLSAKSLEENFVIGHSSTHQVLVQQAPQVYQHLGHFELCLWVKSDQ